jgi:hypothetical protein
MFRDFKIFTHHNHLRNEKREGRGARGGMWAGAVQVHERSAAVYSRAVQATFLPVLQLLNSANRELEPAHAKTKTS